MTPRPPISPVPKPAKRVKVRKLLKARAVPKAFAHRRVPEYQEWIRSFACLIRSTNALEAFGRCPLGIFGSECAHVKSRGAGGDDVSNCVPLCHYHHQEQHRIGIQSFQKKYGLDLYAIAADLGRQYQARVKATRP